MSLPFAPTDSGLMKSSLALEDNGSDAQNTEN
jgi:hypothetical protein